VRCGALDRRQRICHLAVDDAWESFREDGVLAGRLAFDGEAARACLEALGRAVVFCSSELIGLPDADPETTWIEDACDRAFIGGLTEDEPCNVGAGECADGLTCRSESGEGRCWRPGRGWTGDECTTASCDSELWCDSGRCAEHADAGEACDEPRACAGGRFVCVDGTCAVGSVEGEDCTTLSCQEGLACRGDEGAAACRTTDGRHEGDACWVLVGRLGSNCRDGLYCLADTWHPSSGQEMGVGSCVDGGGVLEACSALEPCARGLRCIEGACLRAAVIGGPCSTDDVCPLYHRCEEGLCQLLARPGDGE